MKIRSVLTLLAFSLLGLVLAGCGGGYKAGGISVTLAAVRPADADGAIVTLEFLNENLAALGLSNTTHLLYLNGTMVGKITNTQPIGLPPTSNVKHDVIVKFEKPAVVRELATRAGANAVAYKLESVLYQTIYEDDMKIKTDSTGAVDLSPLAGK